MRRELYQDYFKGKKITVLGLGLLGRGLGDTEFLASTLATEVICTDTRSEDKLKDSLEQIKKVQHKNLSLVIGENRFEDFENKDFILTCPGMPIGYEYLEHAKSKNVPVYMSAALLCSIIMDQLPDVTIIGVTGTRGKSTTTQLIAHVLQENGMKVHLGGNIRGVANLPLLDEVEDGDYVVLELDSWQLQGFGDMKISPHIAVFTSFMDDHMNYYKNDKELYFSDKANIYRYQNEYDVLIASTQAKEEIHKRDKKQELVESSPRKLQMKIIGEHNEVAAGLAYDVGTQCGLSDEEIDTAIATFKPVDGRLEDMGLFHGVRVFNDNNATTGDATVAGIKAIEATYNKQPIVITGGADKGLSKDTYEQYLKDHTQEVVYLAGTGTDTIALPKVHLHERLEDCVRQAFSLAKEGDIILFSPGFASFSKYFNNEYERNDVFVREVKKLA